MSFPVPTIGYVLLIGASAFSLVYAASLHNGATSWSAASAERLQSERRLKVVAESLAKSKPSDDKWLDAEKSKASLGKANASSVVISKFAVVKVAASKTAVEPPLPAGKLGEPPSLPSAPAGATTLRFESAKAK
jgi:hypothetical protein